jgi:hypothetical protein
MFVGGSIYSFLKKKEAEYYLPSDDEYNIWWREG